MAVALIQTKEIDAEVVAKPYKRGIQLTAIFRRLPPNKHGFHIHESGDLRGEGCLGLCAHYDKGKHKHGGLHSRERHTGDLGNIEMKKTKTKTKTKKYYLSDVKIQDLWGRSIIIHEGEDDLGKGLYDDSHITGHSGKRIGCAIFGRMKMKTKKLKSKK